MSSFILSALAQAPGTAKGSRQLLYAGLQVPGKACLLLQIESLQPDGIQYHVWRAMCFTSSSDQRDFESCVHTALVAYFDLQETKSDF